MSSVPQGNFVDPAMVSCDQHGHGASRPAGLCDKGLFYVSNNYVVGKQFDC